MSSIYNDILLKKFIGVAETNKLLTYNNEIKTFSRTNIINSQIYGQTIPSIAPNANINNITKNFTKDSTNDSTYSYTSKDYNWIQYIKQLPLTTTTIISSKSVYYNALLKHSIPFNYDSIYNSYQYTLTTSKGLYNNSNIIANSNYIIDHDSGYLTFINGDWDETLYGSPIISFYRYNGTFGIESELPPLTTTLTLTRGTNGNVNIDLGNLINGYFNGTINSNISTFTFTGGLETGNYSVYLTTNSSTTSFNVITEPGDSTASKFYFSSTTTIPIILYNYIIFNISLIQNNYLITVSNYTVPITVSILQNLSQSDLINTLYLTTISTTVLKNFFSTLSSTQLFLLANTIAKSTTTPTNNVALLNIITNLSNAQLISILQQNQPYTENPLMVFVVSNNKLPSGWSKKGSYLVGPGANLNNANLSGLDLSGSTLTGVISGEITGTPTLPSGWSIKGGYLIGPGAILTGATTLSGLDLSGCTLTGVISGGITGTPTLPSGWSIKGGYLIGPGAILTGATTLNGLNLSGCTLTGVISGGITGMPSALPASWYLISGYLVGPGANLTNAVLQNANISNINLTGAILTGVTSGGLYGFNYTLPTNYQFYNGYIIGPGVNLTDVNLSGCVLSTNISTTTLTRVVSGNITGTPLGLPTGWQLAGGYLIGPSANLTGANLSNITLQSTTNFTGCVISGITSGKIIGNPLGLSTLNAAIINGYLVGPGVNLTNAIINSVNLSNIDLTDAILTGISTYSLSGTPIGLPLNWKIENGYLIGPGANLAGINMNGVALSHCILYNVTSGGIKGIPLNLPTDWSMSTIGGYLLGPGANLTNVSFANFNLSGVNLTNAILTGVTSGGITGTPLALPSGWLVIGGYLIGPNANLNGANLSGLDLSKCTLTGVTSGGITGTGYTLPTGWQIMNGYLVGPGANLTGATLTGAFAATTDLTGVILTGIVSNAITGTPLRFPNTTGWGIQSGYLLGPGINLSGITLKNIDISTIDFTNAMLTGLISSGINGNYILPSKWTLVGGYLIGPNANLTGINIDKLDLSSCTLTNVTSGGITGIPKALPTGWQLFNGYFVGPGANLTDANIAGMTLQSTTDLTGATLTRIISGSIAGTPLGLPSNWILCAGYLIGPNMNIVMTLNVSNVLLLLGLPKYIVYTLTIKDTIKNLLSVSSNTINLAKNVIASDVDSVTITMTQLQTLLSFPNIQLQPTLKIKLTIPPNTVFDYQFIGGRSGENCIFYFENSKYYPSNYKIFAQSSQYNGLQTILIPNINSSINSVYSSMNTIELRAVINPYSTWATGYMEYHSSVDFINTTITEYEYFSVSLKVILYLSPAQNTFISPYINFSNVVFINQTIPSAPTITTVTKTNSNAVVSFNVPSSNGKSTITSYTVRSYNITSYNNGSPIISPTSFNSTLRSSSPITVTGLSVGVGYIFRVFATNSIGNGPESANSSILQM